MPIPLLLGATFWSSITTAATTAFSWIFRKAIISFVILTSLFLLLDYLTPILLRLIGSYTSTNYANILASVPDAVWYFGSAFRVDFGIKAIVSAYVTRFLVRRLPVIG